MRERLLWTLGHGTVLFLGLLGIAVITGHLAILAALLPAAYHLAVHPDSPENAPRAVVVAHLVALAAGWLTYTVLAQGISPTGIEPMSEPGLRLVGSALLAFVGSTAVFYTLDVHHPMAYATLLTAAIGLFPTVPALATGVVAVLFLAGLQPLRRRVGPI